MYSYKLHNFEIRNNKILINNLIKLYITQNKPVKQSPAPIVSIIIGGLKVDGLSTSKESDRSTFSLNTAFF